MLIRRHDVALQTLRPFMLPRAAAQTPRIGGEGIMAAERTDDGVPGGSLEAELVSLRSRVETLGAALEEAEMARATAVEAAFDQGREEGLRAADELGEERLQALRQQFVETSQACLARLSERGELAVEIARTAIHRILGEGSPCAALAEGLIRNAMSQVTSGTVVAVRVSAEDFADDEALTELAREIGGVNFVRVEDLPSGGCELELTLGMIDASLATQLSSLNLVLDRYGSVPS